MERIARPRWETIDPVATLIAAIAFVALWRFRFNILWIVGASALAGFVYKTFF